MIVEVDGQELEFPDSMTRDEVKAVLRQKFARPAYDPTEGMSGTQKFLAGVGKGMTDIARGAGQLVGLVSQQDIHEADLRDRALMNTGAGFAGNMAGMIAPMAATGFIPGAATLGGAAAIGAGTGLLAPIGEGNVATGKLRSAAVGGLLGPATVLAGRGAHAGVNALKGIVEPFTDAGQNAIVGRTLNRFATDAQRAAQDALSARPAVSGYQQTLAEATQDPGLATLQRAVMNTDAAAQIGAVERANAGLLKDAIGGIAGDDVAMAAAKAARESATDALYKSADNVTLPITPELKELLKRPVIRSAMNEARTNAANKGENLFVGMGKKASAVTGKTLHQIKMAIDDAYEAAAPGSAARRAIGQAKKDYLDWVETRISDYGQARQTFAAMSAPVNQMEIGGLLANKLSPALDDFAETGGLRGAMFAQSLRNPEAIVKQATGHSGSLAKILRPDQLQTIEGVGKTLADRASAQNLARPVGTNTAQNLSAQNLMRQIAGPLGLPQSFTEAQFWPTMLRLPGMVMKAQEPSINQKLANAIVDPKLAAQLMASGVPREQVGKIIQQLAVRVAMPGLLSANLAQQ